MRYHSVTTYKKGNNMQVRIPTFYPTKSQREWIEAEKKRTGNSFAAILRNLMQEKIDNE